MFVNKNSWPPRVQFPINKTTFNRTYLGNSSGPRGSFGGPKIELKISLIFTMWDQLITTKTPQKNNYRQVLHSNISRCVIKIESGTGTCSAPAIPSAGPSKMATPPSSPAISKSAKTSPRSPRQHAQSSRFASNQLKMSFSLNWMLLTALFGSNFCLFTGLVSWESEMDTDALFANHSVEEIRTIENKTRLVWLCDV